MNKIVSMEDIVPLMIEQIDNGGDVTFTPKGDSMLPIFRSNRDTVTLRKPQFPLKKYDIAFYVRESGKYVLHRVVQVNSHNYVMRGDNQYYNEIGISDEQIIAVVHSFTRGNKQLSIDSISYRIYCVLWVKTMRIRRLTKKAKRVVGKIKRKMLRIFK